MDTTRVPAWFWAVSVLALLWMLVGLLALAMDFMTDEAALAQMTEAQRQLHTTRPQWVFVVYAVAIFSGLAGAIGLLLRRGWAVPALALSLVAVIVQFGYVFLVMDAIAVMGAAQALPFPLMIFALALLWLWFAVIARRRGWLRA
jgi:hypothetical protein